jgi:plasmid stability protein
MPTLYVENVPEDLYEAIRARAAGNRKSITAEVLALLAESVPTPAEVARRRKFLKDALKMRSIPPSSGGRFPTAEEMHREDRAR